MEEVWFMKKPCSGCPYLRTTKPFLTAARGEELAYHAENPYNTFTCHKTMEASDDEDDDPEYEGSTVMVHTDHSLECAGFLSMQIYNGRSTPKGFIPSPDAYEDAWEMTEAYEEANE